VQRGRLNWFRDRSHLAQQTNAINLTLSSTLYRKEEQGMG